MISKSFYNKSTFIISVYIIQAILVLCAIKAGLWYCLINFGIELSFIFIFLVNVLCLIYILTVKHIIGYVRNELELKNTIIKLKESKEIISYLRAHKHDFFNHLQVIRGLAQIGKGERIISYVDSIVDEVGNVFDITNIAIPEVAVVIMQKTGEASKKNIQTEVILNTDLADLKGNHMDFSQLLFNLLDNSIAALSKPSLEKKKLRITLDEDKNNYYFMVYNNGPAISRELQEKIYDKGFSTKNGNGDGMGLYIVKNIVEKYGGEIKLTSQEIEGTKFVVTIPK